MCRYLVVRSDDTFTESVPNSTVAAFVATADPLPGVQLLLLHCDAAGGYAFGWEVVDDETDEVLRPRAA